jgi:hypothetical protein
LKEVIKMFCPRCGSPNTETTKFCRQCGLPLNQIVNYVESGGTAPLSASPASSSPISTADGLTPGQRLTLTILFFVFAPAIFGVLGKVLGMADLARGLAGISGVLMPIGVVWAIFRYKAHVRRLQQQNAQQTIQPQNRQSQPVLPPQSYQPPLSSPPTNPIATPVRGSVTEDETQRFPGQNK